MSTIPVIKEENDIYLSPPKKTSQIDGIGLWNSFTRSFQSPLMACLDLIDNVFDAAPHCKGKLEIDVDVKLEKDEENETKTTDLELDSSNGFYILNNCHQAVKPMKDVLTVFNSTKGSACSQIGENGVGAKQGCATLSDISFVMSRNEHVYSLGILAKNLQKETGIYLPSFEFEFDKELEKSNTSYTLYTFLRDEINSIANLNDDIAVVIKEYGFGDEEKGVYRLARNMMRMYEKKPDKNWKEESHVFGICVHDLKHGDNSTFLRKVRNELPQHYLHVPEDFHVVVGLIRVNFSYWPNRLVNLTRFEVRIPKDQYINDDNLHGTNDDHSLNVYIGFDAIRCSDMERSKAASLFFYSRKFGRLIKSHRDARGTLLLSAGGTQFCQALTVIVDDYSGALPLNPTKQDFAFGEAKNGEMWESNLHRWVSAVTKVYYNYYLENLCNKQKKILTDMVKDEASQAKKKDILQGSVSAYKSIDQLKISTFDGINWKFQGDAQNGVIYLISKKNVKECHGEDIDLQLKKKQEKKKSKSNSASAPSVNVPTHELFGDADNMTYATKRSSLRIAQRASRKHHREDEDTTEKDDNSRGSFRKQRKKATPSKENANIAQLKKQLQATQQVLERTRKELADAQLDIQMLENDKQELKIENSSLKRENSKLKRDLEIMSST